MSEEDSFEELDLEDEDEFQDLISSQLYIFLTQVFWDFLFLAVDKKITDSIFFFQQINLDPIK